MKTARFTMCAVLAWALILCAGSVLGAMEASIYLVPRVALGGGPLELRDIARIEVRDGDREALGAITIDGALYADGYVDRREISDLVKARFQGTVMIFGGGVAVAGARQVPEESRDSAMAIRKGEKVRYSVHRGGVRIEINGVAMEDGVEGDEVRVKLHTNKIVPGKVSPGAKVESGS